jgi:hypothetical protein
LTLLFVWYQISIVYSRSFNFGYFLIGTTQLPRGAAKFLVQTSPCLHGVIEWCSKCTPKPQYPSSDKERLLNEIQGVEYDFKNMTECFVA